MEGNKSVYRLLVFTNFFLFFGFNVWRTVFNNFAVEELAIQADQIGLVQSLREVPGFLGFSLGFLVLFLSEMNILGLSVILLGLGLIATGWTKSFGAFILSTMVMSVGFHYFYAASSSAVLMLAKQDDSPRVLGQLRGIGSLAAVVSTALVYLLVTLWSYRGILYLAGAITCLGGLIALPGAWQGKWGIDFGRKVIFRRRYALYYIMTFLTGSRRHIFTTFAIFLLVSQHGISARETAILFLVNSLITAYVSVQLGRWVARFGERAALTLNFSLLALIFLGYAYVFYLPLLYLLFVIDNTLFGFSIALDTYLQKIALTPEEITANISLGQTINHVAALIVPIGGGLIWEAFGYRTTFLIGVAFVLLSLILSQWIKVEGESLPSAA